MQFFEAQERFRKGSLFSHEGYVRDLLRNYGNGGKAFNLPQVSKQTYEQGLKYRHAEKMHYASLQERLAAAEHTVMQTRNELEQSRADVDYFANFVNEYLTPSNATSGDWHSERELGSNGGDYVLPAEDRPSADDSNLGQSEAIISSTEAGHEPSRARSNRSRRDNAQLHTGKEGGEDGTQGSDPGRAPPDATNGTESDVGGPADQHRAEE